MKNSNIYIENELIPRAILLLQAKLILNRFGQFGVILNDRVAFGFFYIVAAAHATFGFV